KLLAFSYTQARNSPQGQQMLMNWPPKLRADMALLAEEYPNVTEDQATEARYIVQQYFLAFVTADRTLLVFAIPGDALCLVYASGSLILTLLLGRPPLFRLFGMTLQTASGEPAGRWRCLLRSSLVWAPFLVGHFLCVLSVLDEGSSITAFFVAVVIFL